MESFEVKTPDHTCIVDVTEEVHSAVPDDGTGVCTVFVRHTTAGVFINEAEDRLMRDFEDFLGEVVPDEGHTHDKIDGNADSHLRAGLVGSDVSVPVDNGEAVLGAWQSVLLFEADGPRRREVVVQLLEG